MRLNGSKTGNSLRGQKNYATPTNKDFGQTSNWSKLVVAYLPVARLTILDRLDLKFLLVMFSFILVPVSSHVF